MRKDSLKTAMSLTNGGRALNALKEIRNEHLSPVDRFVLVMIGSEMNFMAEFTETRWITNTRLREITGLSKSAVIRSIKTLVDPEGLGEKADPYITCAPEFDPKTGQQLANRYGLTDRAFLEYAALLETRVKDQTPSQRDTPPVSAGDPPRSTVTPPPCQADTHNTFPNTEANTSSNILRAGAREPKKLINTLSDKSVSVTSPKVKGEARELFRSIFMGEKFRDVGSVLVGADIALEELGLEPIRRAHQTVRRNRLLGRVSYDPNHAVDIIKQLAYEKESVVRLVKQREGDFLS
jgi:hypothetical protein